MDFTCCTSKRPKNKIEVEKEKIKKRAEVLDIIQNFKTAIEIECSYLMCSKTGIRPLEKQATVRNNIYYFCSNDCWAQWLKNYDIKNSAVSPSTLDSPEYVKKCSQNLISKIPLLEI